MGKIFIIGISGGIGSGKSTFAQFLREAGIPCLDADKISHHMTAAGGPSMPEIEEVFGRDYLNCDGSLNREAMAELAFRDKKSLDLLSRIIHKDVFRYLEQSIQELETQGQPVVALDVPIPVQDGFLDRCDIVICLWASEELRLARLQERGMSANEVRRRMAVQMSAEDFASIADYFILNDSSLEDLRQEAEIILEKELSSRGIPYKRLV